MKGVVIMGSAMAVMFGGIWLTTEIIHWALYDFFGASSWWGWLMVVAGFAGYLGYLIAREEEV